jgi:hypothetical protein
MPKGPQGRKDKAPKSKNPTGKRPEDSATRGDRMQEATNQEIGDTADTITRKIISRPTE